MATSCLAQFPWGEMYVGSKLGSRMTRPPGGLRWSPPVLECPPQLPLPCSLLRVSPKAHSARRGSDAGGQGWPRRPRAGRLCCLLRGYKSDSQKVRGKTIRISCNCPTLFKGSPRTFPRPFNRPPLVGHLGRSVTTLPGGYLWIQTLPEQPEEGSVEEGASGVSTSGHHVSG